MVRIAIFIALLFPVSSFGQLWKKDTATGAMTLQHMQYTEFAEVVQGPDGAHYVLSYHKPANYRKRKYEKEIQCVVSRIDAKGNISYETTLGHTPKRPLIRVYNNEVYICDLDETPIDIGGQPSYHNICQVYNANWKLERTINIPSPGQNRLVDFAVTAQGVIIQLTSNNYTGNYNTPTVNTGCWLTFCSPTGAIEHSQFFLGYAALSRGRAVVLPLRVAAGDSVYLRLYKPFQRHSTQFDSLLHFGFDSKWRYGLAAAEELPPVRPNTGTEVTLANGKKLITFDSGFVARDGRQPRANKLALVGTDDLREWTMSLHPYWDLYKIKPLSDGGYTAFVNAKWDSTSLVIGDQEGSQYALRTLPMGPGQRGKAQYRLLDHYEMRPGEIWLFYEVERQGAAQAIRFERIKF